MYNFRTIAMLFVAFIVVIIIWTKRNRRKMDFSYNTERVNSGFNGENINPAAYSQTGVDEVWLSKHVSDLLTRIVQYTFTHKVALLEDEVDSELIYSLADSVRKLNPELNVTVGSVDISEYNVESSQTASTVLVTAECDVSLTLSLGERRLGIMNYNTPHRSEFKLCFARKLNELGSSYKLVDFFITG